MTVFNKNDGRRGGFELKCLVRTQLKRGTMSNDIQIVKIIRNAVSETKSTGKIEVRICWLLNCFYSR
jgi:hypothetical protein